jgi:uncharacterized membrane protein
MKALFSDQPINSRLFWRFCLALCVLGLAVRLPMLSSRSLWLDETYSAWFSALPLHELWTSVPLYETHPPIFYTLLKGWSVIFGNSEAALRSLSVLASVATILLVSVSGRALRSGAVGDRVALLAALLLAVNRSSIQFAQQSRPYALETLFASAAILFSLIVLRHLSSKADEERRWPVLLPGMLGLGICAAATLWLHNTAIFIVFGIWSGLTISLLLFVRKPRALQALAIGIPGLLALLIWSPFVPLLIRASANVANMSFWIRTGPADLITAYHLAAGGTFPMIPMMLLCLAGIWVMWRTDRAATLHICVILVLPLAIVLGYSYLLKPIYINRLFGWMAPSMMVLAAIGIQAVLKKPLRRYSVTILLVVLSAISTMMYYLAPTEDWRGFVDTVASQTQPGDAAIVYPNELNVVLHYYVPPQRPFPVVNYIPAPFPALGRNAPYVGNLGAPAVQATDAPQVRSIVEQHHRIWVISRFGKLYDREDVVHTEVTKKLKLVRSYGDNVTKVELFE